VCGILLLLLVLLVLLVLLLGHASRPRCSIRCSCC
jgi:hypothetical protein